MPKGRKSLYMLIAVVLMLGVWAGIFFYPSPEFDEAIEQLRGPKAKTAALSALVLTLKLEQDTAEVHLGNAAAEVVRLPDEVEGRAFGLIITGDDGAEVSRRFSPVKGRDIVWVSLLPGAEYVRRFELRRMLRLMPGTYSLRASYEPALIDNTCEDVRLRSNEVSYEVGKE